MNINDDFFTMSLSDYAGRAHTELIVCLQGLIFVNIMKQHEIMIIDQLENLSKCWSLVVIVCPALFN